MTAVIIMPQPEPEPQFTLDRKLWLAADLQTVVEDGDSAARSLLGTPGKRIPLRDAIRFGLTEDAAAVKQAKPASNKQAKPAATKTAGSADSDDKAAPNG